jgi:hypothetical protein
MHPEKISRGEWIASAGGILLAIAVFLPWYTADSGNPNARFPGASDLTVSAWQIHDVLRWIWLVTAIAPLVLTWIIVRDHQLSWPRGQMTSVVAVIAIGLIFVAGIVDRPGEPSSAISLSYGWFLALIGAILMLVGSVMRTAETEIKRKPPGTL